MAKCEQIDIPSGLRRRCGMSVPLMRNVWSFTRSGGALTVSWTAHEGRYKSRHEGYYERVTTRGCRDSR